MLVVNLDNKCNRSKCNKSDVVRSKVTSVTECMALDFPLMTALEYVHIIKYVNIIRDCKG